MDIQPVTRVTIANDLKNPDGQEAQLTKGFSVTNICGGGAAISLSVFGLMMGKGKPEEHPYELLLAINDISHRFTKVGTPMTNGFVERFNRTILDEFFREAFRKKFYGAVDELQKDMDRWLEHYNKDLPHRGYRNQGRKPYETFTLGKKEVEKTKAKRKDTKEVKEAA